MAVFLSQSSWLCFLSFCLLPVTCPEFLNFALKKGAILSVVSTSGNILRVYWILELVIVVNCNIQYENIKFIPGTVFLTRFFFSKKAVVPAFPNHYFICFTPFKSFLLLFWQLLLKLLILFSFRFYWFYWLFSLIAVPKISQLTFTCSKSTIETLEKAVKYV